MFSKAQPGVESMIYLLKDIKQSLHFWLLRRKADRREAVGPAEVMKEPVDFVVTWVDGSDPEWRAQKEEYERKNGIFRSSRNNGEERYRDWDIFRYWFRAVEAYAPWVRTVYLVTCGHTPEWLNLSAPKLKVIRHSDYIPAEDLPTFNSVAIELNFHRIRELSEHFVYFNDDVFLMRPCRPEDFFREGMPNHCAVATPLRNPDNATFYHHQFTALGAINRVFGGHVGEIVSAHPEKWFSRKYGNEMLYNKYAAQLDFLPGMFFSHLAVPMKKSTFEKVWAEFPDLLRETSSHRFRKAEDVMHQIMSMWEIMNGDFYPASMEHYGTVFSSPGSQIDALLEAVGGKKHLSICINDSEYVSHEEYLKIRKVIREKMEEVFPEKSSFEK